VNAKADALAKVLIRNFNEATTEREQREPLYDSVCARLARGTAAKKLGVSIDTVAPGMRSCPYHFHHAQEEMFIVLEGTGTLRVADEMLPLKAGDIAFLGRGDAHLIGSSLEQSNVDMASEFTKMILAQRGYQANSKMITVSDQLLVDTLNLKQ